MCELVKERHLLRAWISANFAAHVTEADAIVVGAVVGESVIVRREHAPWAEIHEVVRHRGGDRGAVAGRCPSAELVHRHERVRRGAP